jgi:four helix bundle protein
MHNFRKLDIWIEGRKIVKEIYILSNKFLSHEKFGLINQIQRAAVSIPSNIAEGSAKSDKEFSHFLEHSIGSSFEVETQLCLAFDLGYIANEEYENVILLLQNHQRKMVNLKKHLN